MNRVSFWLVIYEISTKYHKTLNEKKKILFGITMNMVSYTTTKVLYILFKWQNFPLDSLGFLWSTHVKIIAFMYIDNTAQ